VLRVASHIAHVAGDPGDTISDFKFAPATITIHVGDTITWTNNGPTDHTATAKDGSFDTGTLKKGQSASHTFTSAGTFAYICSLHPFMHGTVVVLGSTSGGGSGGGGRGSGTSGTTSGSPGSSSPTSTGSTPATGSSSPTGSTGASGSTPTTTTGTATSAAPSTDASTTSGTLPTTGLDLAPILLVGLLLIGAGIGLRARVRVRS
jgi:plastocyanin